MAVKNTDIQIVQIVELSRRQTSVGRGVASVSLSVTPDRPQMSRVMSPLLFSLLMNSASAVRRHVIIKPNLFNFADDVKIFLRVNSTDDWKLLRETSLRWSLEAFTCDAIPLESIEIFKCQVVFFLPSATLTY